MQAYYVIYNVLLAPVLALCSVDMANNGAYILYYTWLKLSAIVKNTNKDIQKQEQSFQVIDTESSYRNCYGICIHARLLDENQVLVRVCHSLTPSLPSSFSLPSSLHSSLSLPPSLSSFLALPPSFPLFIPLALPPFPLFLTNSFIPSKFVFE